MKSERLSQYPNWDHRWHESYIFASVDCAVTAAKASTDATDPAISPTRARANLCGISPPEIEPFTLIFSLTLHYEPSSMRSMCCACACRNRGRFSPGMRRRPGRKRGRPQGTHGQQETRQGAAKPPSGILFGAATMAAVDILFVDGPSVSLHILLMALRLHMWLNRVKEQFYVAPPLLRKTRLTFFLTPIAWKGSVVGEIFFQN